MRQTELQTVSNRNDKHTDIDDNQWSPHLPSSVSQPCYISDSARCRMSLRGLSLFKSQATQTLWKFYPEFPLFIRSSSSGTLLSRHSYSSLASPLVKFSDFQVGVCVILMILILDQLIFNKDTNVKETGKHRCSTVCSMILYTGKSYGCYEWRHTIYACNLHNCLTT